jgi:hypothetical protein
MEGNVDLGRAWTERPVNASRRFWLRIIVAVTATMLCTLGLSAVAGQAARAATVPVVTNVSPYTGNAEVENGVVVILGSGFTGATAVDFGSVPADRFTVDSDTLIEAFVMGTPGDSTVDVTVTTPEGTSATSPFDQYTFILSPQLASISPSNGPAPGGNTVTITGADFTGATVVSFDSFYLIAPGTLTEAVVDAPSFTVDSDTQITAVVPAAPGGPGTGARVTVTTPNGDTNQSNNNVYSWNPGPVVQTISSGTVTALGGGPLTLTGTGFTGASAVTFGTVPATSFTVNSDTSITATAPAQSAGRLFVTVTTPNGTSGAPFLYVAAPVITGVSPAAGQAAGGNTVIITGTGFRSGKSTVATAVAFGTVPAASFTVNSSTQITATVPPGAAGTVDIILTVLGNVTTPPTPADQYTYLPVPAVTGVSPAAGPTAGANTVTVTGTGFTGATAVSFGAVPAASFTADSDTSITATVPAGAVGTDDVAVTTPGGTSPTSAADQYTYDPVPAVTGVSPGSGLSVGGNTVTITGTGFTGASAVLFGAVPATSFTVNSDTSITATVPAGAVGIDDVTVTTPGGTSPTSAADQYVYHPTCTTTITGNHAGGITVSSGLTCLVNATQAGQVTVAAGAALSVTGSIISGSVTATDPAGITYCGSTESGSLTVTGATGPVVLGGALPDGTACAANTISGAVSVTGASAPVTVTGLRQAGTLTLENDTAGVDLEGGQINGRIYVSGNTATAPAAITVAGAVVTGSLYCTGNNPPPGDNGSINTVSGTATDQCAAIAQR